jgi:hypothetical protein
MTKLLCEKCQGEMRSANSWIRETLIGYYSPPGHNHDNNCRKREYECSCGNTKVISIRRRCPNPECDWVGKETCFCHEGPKVDEWPEEPEGK